MMFALIGAIALDAPQFLCSIHESSMSLLSAIFVLENARVHVSTTNYSNMSSYVEATVNKSLTQYTTLGILDVNPYNNHIKLWRYFDNT